jgi:6-pyruvoyltetrahydropterin/6-carboxytetrahydropterin synthase
MSVIRLTKEFTFEAAHMLEGYDGLCREIHGHSYKLFVTVKGEPVSDPESPKLGMVMDFGALKRIVNEQIVDRLDHAFMMRNTLAAEEIINDLGYRFSKVVLTEYQPTCENMLADFAARLQSALPANVELYSLRLHETATSYAEWYNDDNR